MMRVLGDRVLVALPPANEAQDEATGYTYQPGQASESGILLAKPADTYNVETSTRGIVVQVGEKRNACDVDDVRRTVHDWFLGVSEHLGLIDIRDEVDRLLMQSSPAPFDVQVGDCVLFAPSSGEQVRDGEIDYVVLHEHEILAVVEPLQEGKAA